MLFFLIVSAALTSFHPTPSAPMNWAGTWSTNLGELTLQQNKSEVTGYSSTRGTIKATYHSLTGILSGTFVKDKTTGTFSVKSSGTNAFTGTWQYTTDTKPRGEWKGIRKAPVTTNTTTTTTTTSSSTGTISTREKNGVSWTGTWTTNILGKVILAEDMSTQTVKGRFLITKSDFIREGTIEATTNHGNYANTRKWISGVMKEGGAVIGRFVLVLNFHNGDNLDQFSGQCYYNHELTSVTPIENMPMNTRGSRTSTAIPDLSVTMIK